MKRFRFILCHMGLLLTILGMALGQSSLRILQLTLPEGGASGVAWDRVGNPVELGMVLELHRFTEEYYPDGRPSFYESEISVGTEVSHALVRVNKPLRVSGWDIYQYDRQTLLLVRDPWLPLVYFGYFLLMAGALCLLFRKVSGSAGIIVPLVLIAVWCLGTIVFRNSLHARPLIPVLRSEWFAPHVVSYMLSFALLGAGTILYPFRKTSPMADYLVYWGIALFTIGMLLGAFWAKEAWGHYWTWDPKETWALVTWLCYLLYLHLRKLLPERRRLDYIVLLVAFACMMMCWWGVNYLPSAQGQSLHTYSVL